jgi:hypothetical protein
MNENIIKVKKSIFKQPVHRKLYSFKEIYNYDIFRTGTEKGIFGETEFVKTNDIFTCELEMPMLEVGEEFYIEELNQTVKVTKRIRSSKENVCYYTEPETIEDEKTIESKLKAEELQKLNILKEEEVRKLNDEIFYLKEFKTRVKKSFWFKFIKE